MMKNERRKYPRISLRGEVSLSIEGVVRTGTLVNLSPAGLQIECRHQLVEQLSKIKSPAGQYTDFEVEFLLPDNTPIICRSTVSFCRRLSQDSYQLGLSFVTLPEGAEERVDNYIDHAAAA